jgi:hypothetical protein
MTDKKITPTKPTEPVKNSDANDMAKELERKTAEVGRERKSARHHCFMKA